MRIFCLAIGHLFENLRDDARAHRQAAFANGELRTLLQRHRGDQFHFQIHAVPRHHPLHPLRPRDRPRHVHRPNVELRPVPRKERLVPPPLLFLQHVHFAPELRVRRDALRLRQHHPPLHLLPIYPPHPHPPPFPPPPP